MSTANRNRDRYRRAARLRLSYHRTGDRRQFKRARRIEHQLLREQMIGINRGFRALGEALARQGAEMRRVFESIGTVGKLLQGAKQFTITEHGGG